jgi:putative transcriptional regulator
MSKEETIANKVCEFRRDKGVTQQELAKAVGVSRQTIISLEKQDYDPSVLHALKIAKFFGVCVDKIFSITTKMEKKIGCSDE